MDEKMKLFHMKTIMKIRIRRCRTGLRVVRVGSMKSPTLVATLCVFFASAADAGQTAPPARATSCTPVSSRCHLSHQPLADGEARVCEARVCACGGGDTHAGCVVLGEGSEWEFR